VSDCATNIVNLVPRTLEQIALAKRRGLEISKDRESLTELSLHLRSLKRDLAVEFSVFDADDVSIAEWNLKLQADAFVKQIEALEAGMNKLIGAMAVHQPR
jgi:DNA-directed RNA polymerase subunit L